MNLDIGWWICCILVQSMQNFKRIDKQTQKFVVPELFFSNLQVAYYSIIQEWLVSTQKTKMISIHYIYADRVP